jgi:hypothetical protein
MFEKFSLDTNELAGECMRGVVSDRKSEFYEWKIYGCELECGQFDGEGEGGCREGVAAFGIAGKLWEGSI